MIVILYTGLVSCDNDVMMSNLKHCYCAITNRCLQTVTAVDLTGPMGKWLATLTKRNFKITRHFCF